MILPFGELPLKTSPFYSRLYNNLQSNYVNYTLVAFNPGYALQASELNEVQEYFFLNQNLTQRMNYNWTSTTNAYHIPYWEGAIPLSPLEDGISPVRVEDIDYDGLQVTGKFIIPSGWYLCTDTTSKLSFWVVNPTDYEETLVGTGFNTYYVGFEGTFSKVDCCPTDTCDEETQSPELRDNSQGYTNTWNTCGASRFKFTLSNIDISGSLPSNFYPIIKIVIDNGDAVATFMDGQTIQVVDQE